MTERSILAAVSGIEANQTWLDGIGNNIANSDTTGYKDSSVQFSDLLAEQISGASAPTTTTGGVNALVVGSGVRVAGNDVNLQEGSLEQTGNPTDVAIQGSGYFVVQSAGSDYYTRDGSLTTDANGDLTTQSGGLVQGWEATGAGVVDTNAPLTAIKIPTGETIGASKTTALPLSGNLPAFTVGSGSAETTTMDAYDAAGNAVPITLTFTPSATVANTWTVQGSLTEPSGTTLTDIWTNAPTVTFGSDGQISGITINGTAVSANSDGSYSVPLDAANANTATGNDASAYLTAAGYTASAPLDFTFPDPGSSTAVTQFAGTSTIALGSGNGYPSGTLQNYSIGGDGVITGSFSNGETLSIGQIALANFANPGGLTDIGGGLYATSPNSGAAETGTPGSGGRGTLLGGELEQSNVDLGTELTNLITAQEAYTANTKVLTTSSTVIQALENVQ